MKSALVGLGAFAVVSCAAIPAFADAGPKIYDSLWLPLGVNLGYSLNPDPAPNGFLVGPEASFVYLDRSAAWVGAYADVLRDFGTETTRMSLGVEGGFATFGLDFGYVRSFEHGGSDGVRGRFLFSLAALHFYGGVGRTFESGNAPAATHGELGVLLKLPIPLWEGEGNMDRWRRRPPPDTYPHHRPYDEDVHRHPESGAPESPPPEPLVPVGPPTFAEPPPG